MFTGSIKISELDGLTTVTSDDFFPVVDSGSLTTFRVTVATLNNWFAISGSVLSASWASSSINSIRSISASFASASISSSFAVSASVAFRSVSGSFTISASYASGSTTASYALRALSASFAPFTQSIQVSASYASASLSASYALTASFAPPVGDTVPIGTIMAFGTASCPNNFLECNGDAKLTASFLDLYNSIKTSDLTASFGYLCDQFGNRTAGGFYFKLPDLRGEFLRGWDNGRGIDAGRTFGSSQTSSVGSHYHGVGAFIAATNDDAHFIVRSWNDGISYTGRVLTGDSGNNTTVALNNPSFGIATTGPASSAGDVRPRNIAILYGIKYSNAVNFANLISSSLAGDVVGNISATNVVAIQSVPVTSSAPTNGQVLAYNSGSGKWVPTTVISSGLVAWATVLIPTASNFSSDNPATVASGNSTNKPVILNSFNISDISWTARTQHPDPVYSFGKPDNSNGQKESVNFLVTLSSAVSNLNYAIMGTWSENGSQATDLSDEGVLHFYPLGTRTSTKMTASMNGGEFSGNPQACWFSIVIYA